MEDYHDKARVLIEALPWIRSASGATVVIKYGGAAMVDPHIRANVMGDIALMKLVGINPVIVHGGGKEISALMQQLDMDVAFIDGQRVTTPEAMNVVKMVLAGKVNKELVRDLNNHGVPAVGISGEDARLLTASQRSVALNRIGVVTAVNTALLDDLIANDYVPVVATVAAGDDGDSFNVNADLAAGALAAALGADKMILLTDVEGIYRDYTDKDTLVAALTKDEATELLSLGSLTEGMIPKMESCLTALEAGVPRVHILNGTLEHALLLEVFTDRGIGTMITPGGEEL